MKQFAVNHKQLYVIGALVALFLFSELFPPYLYEDGDTSAEKSAGYHFILGESPKVKSSDEMNRIFEVRHSEYKHHYSIKPDYIRLYGQRVILLVLLCGFQLLLDRKKSLFKTIIGGLFAYSALLLLGLYVLFDFYEFVRALK